MEKNDLPTVHLFGDMLDLSTSMLIETEDALLWQRHLSALDHLFDIGSGNGAYLTELFRRYPHTAFTGIEADQDTFHLAMKRAPADIRLLHRCYEEYQPERHYAAMLARLIIRHIRDRLHLCSWMHRHLEPGGLVFLLDFADEQFHGDALLPQFTALFRNLRAPLLQRSFLALQDAIRLEWTQQGFALLEKHTYGITAEDPTMKRRLLAYMKLITERYCDAARRESILKELAVWGNHPQATLSLPMFGLILQKI